MPFKDKTWARREAGVRVMENFHLRHPIHNLPDYNTPIDHLPKSPLRSQFSEEGLLELEQLDPYDPDYRSKRAGIISEHRRCYEEIPASSYIIDFSNVMMPLFPHKAHPARRGSLHPEAQLYRDARAQARGMHPQNTPADRRHRDVWYWSEMDAGRLPQNFNPYIPNSPRHEAFKDRISLIDDRPTAVSEIYHTVAGNVGTARQEVLLTTAQIKRRAKRKSERGARLTDQEFEILFPRPLEEWSLQELAKGYPKNAHGEWPSHPPNQFLRQEIRERIERRFKTSVKERMNVSTVTALETIQDILDNEDIDPRGRPIVPASTKLDTAKLLIEHLLGKPKQHVETEINGTLHSILAAVMVSPEQAVTPGHPELPVGPTGKMLVAQRGSRSNYEDTDLQLLQSMGVVDDVIDVEVEED